MEGQGFFKLCSEDNKERLSNHAVRNEPPVVTSLKWWIPLMSPMISSANSCSFFFVAAFNFRLFFFSFSFSFGASFKCANYTRFFLLCVCNYPESLVCIILSVAFFSAWFESEIIFTVV